MKKPFIDRVRISVSAGKGGNGCISFRREKYEPRGGPDGGRGGSGGDVVIEASDQVGGLTGFYYQPLLRAASGGSGGGQKKTGRGGADLVRPAPLGTVIRKAATGELVADLVEEGQRVILARGGRGGKGNSSFATSTNRAPRISQPGEPGEEGDFELELKILAEVGLVGYPNAGKSTLISRISRARPRIAPYPFTTLAPYPGMVEDPEGVREPITVADIPGLVEGAHRDVGLGHLFLRHIERSRVLLFVIDMAGVDGRDPFDDYHHLQRELKLHLPELLSRPFLIAANKMDLEPAAEKYRRFLTRTGLAPGRVFAVSALKEEGLKELVRALFRLVPEQALPSSEPAVPDPGPAPESAGRV
ncbi:MAG: GTPase ObgE [Candidatus Erginobacter occultus]|nr:GTPase ObgE [Candidatus Erginobacter occultus]